MPHRLNAFLASNQGLRQLSSKAKQLETLQRHFDLIARPPLQLSSRVLQLREQVLVIGADNGAVAMKLRQMTGELISLFQARGCEVTGIQIRVQVSTPRLPVRAVPRKLGSAAKKSLEILGDSLLDSPLKSALRRLSRRA